MLWINYFRKRAEIFTEKVKLMTLERFEKQGETFLSTRGQWVVRILLTLMFALCNKGLICLTRAVKLDPDLGDSWACFYRFELQHGTEVISNSDWHKLCINYIFFTFLLSRVRENSCEKMLCGLTLEFFLSNTLPTPLPPPPPIVDPADVAAGGGGEEGGEGVFEMSKS